MLNINKKVIIRISALIFSQNSRALAFIRTPVLPIKSGATYHIDHWITHILNFSTLYSWLFLFFVIALIIMACLIIKLNRIRRKGEELFVHFLNTFHDLEKPLDLIKGPLNEISNDNNLEESNKNKLRLAIWSTQKAQKSIIDLINQEKTNLFFQSLIKSKIGIKNHLKEKIEKSAFLYQSQRKDPNVNVSENLKRIEYSQTDQIFMEKLISIVKRHIDEVNFTVDTLSQEIGMSRSSLYHRIKDLCNCAPADFIRRFRLDKAKELLETNQYTVSEIAFKTGFSDAKYFRAVFKKEYKNSPRNFTKINKEEQPNSTE